MPPDIDGFGPGTDSDWPPPREKSRFRWPCWQVVLGIHLTAFGYVIGASMAAVRLWEGNYLAACGWIGCGICLAAWGRITREYCGCYGRR